MKRFLLSLLLTAPVLTAAAQNHNFDVARNLDIFNALYKELDLSYVDTLDADKNIGNAINYMLHQLDPYTEFYKEDEATDLKQLTTGRYAGIGSPIISLKASAASDSKTPGSSASIAAITFSGSVTYCSAGSATPLRLCTTM